MSSVVGCEMFVAADEGKWFVKTIVSSTKFFNIQTS
jgi:hypothetical protein